MITAAQENAKMLASILGIGEDEAASRLDRTVLITADEDQVGFSKEVRELLERTVKVTGEVIEGSDLEIVIGLAEPRGPSRRLYAAIDAGGVTVSQVPKVRHGKAPALFASVAATMVAAAAFTLVIDDPALPKVNLPLDFDFGQLGVPADALSHRYDLTGAVLIGAGAVAHGFLRALRHLPAGGELTVVDPKVVGGGNPNRCLYLDDSDIGKSKADALSERAQPDLESLHLRPYVGDFKKFTKENGPSPTVIVTVDSRIARRSIQSELPGRVIDASTTDVREVIVHSHRQPTEFACLSCIYRHVPDELARERSIASGLGVELSMVQSGFITEEAASQIERAHPAINKQALIGMAYDSLYKQLCGEAALRTPEGKQVLAPFAFVSMLAGALLACEFVRSERGLADTNYWAVNPWAVPIARNRRLRPRISDCEFCSKPSATKIASQLWG